MDTPAYGKNQKPELKNLLQVEQISKYYNKTSKFHYQSEEMQPENNYLNTE